MMVSALESQGYRDFGRWATTLQWMKIGTMVLARDHPEAGFLAWPQERE